MSLIRRSFQKNNQAIVLIDRTSRSSIRIITMHPLVRNLYKRVLHVGRDYPTGLEHVKRVWKKALRNPENCPSCFRDGQPVQSDECREEILFAVNRGRFMVKEMIGVIQLKKYRTMNQRYGSHSSPQQALRQAMERIEEKATTK